MWARRKRKRSEWFPSQTAVTAFQTGGYDGVLKQSNGSLLSTGEGRTDGKSDPTNGIERLEGDRPLFAHQSA
jgi:hypothetical protein